MQFKLRLSITLIVLLLFQKNIIAADKIADFFQYLNSKSWQTAISIAKIAKEPALVKLALSQQFLDTSCKTNRFEDVVNFTYHNPHWAQVKQLKVKAEEYLTANTDKTAIFHWFQKNTPHTGKAYKFYATAAAQMIDDQQKLSTIIKNGWVHGDFSKNEEREYLKKFKSFLNEQDHIRRIDEKLWQDDVAEAKNLLNMVSSGYQQSFTAQIAIINKSHNADQLFKKLPIKYYTQGLLYRYLDARKKLEADNYTLKLFKLVHQDHEHSEQWCKLQLYYAREFIEQKNFAASYQILQQNLAVSHSEISEKEWLAGWIALRFLNKAELASRHFIKFNKVVKTPISISRGMYWLGRAYEAHKEKEQAIESYKKAAQYSYSFYGQLASLELKQDKLILPISPQIATNKNLPNHDLIRATELLIEYGNTELAHIYSKAAVSGVATPDKVLGIARKVKANHKPYYMVEIAKIATHHHIFLKDYAFPTPYKISNTPIEAALAYGIIRQESVFDQYAVSTANAMGLMQLVKDTACKTARTMSMKCNIAKLTSDPEYNIKLGSQHLKDLLAEYNGSYILAIASYNAGGHRSKKWIELHGDPRKMKNIRQVVDWVELIPFSETRNYVHRVLENIQVYRTILTKNNKLQLKRDLLS